MRIASTTGFVALALSANVAFAQSTDEGREMELFQLDATLNQSTKVASQKEKSIRESPAIITLISRDEIVNSGARDLLDVMQLVPGFHQVFTELGGVTVGLRGNPGGVLLLVDGIPQNEVLFSQLQLGNRYPVDQIQSIEIIRGPGSAEYGGYAEEAVISVHTRTTKDLKGVSVSNIYGRYPRGLAQNDLSIYAGGGEADPDGLQVTFTGFIGQGNRSDNKYAGQLNAGQLGAIGLPNAAGFDMADQSELNPIQLNLGAEYKHFKARAMYDDYTQGSRDGQALVTLQPPTRSFRNLFLMAQYDGQITDKLRIVPRLDFQSQTPWADKQVGTPDFFWVTAIRTTASLNVVYDILDNISLSAGAQGYWDHAQGDGPVTDAFGPGNNTIDYTNGALFAEALWESVIGNLVGGVRFEANSQYGTSVVPRLGLTKKIGRFHFKLLGSGAFRAPGIEEQNAPSLTRVGPPPPQFVNPERIWVYEAEVGYQFTDHLFASVNAFDSTINDFILYDYDPTTNQSKYVNGPQTGSRGFEADFKAQYAWGYADVNYSFYTTAHKNQVAQLQILDPQADGTFKNVEPLASVGFPEHKVALKANIKLWKSLSFNPSAVVMTERWTYPTADLVPIPVAPGVAVVPRVGTLKPTTLLNAFFLYKDAFVQGLDVGVGCYNLLNQSNLIPQEVNLGHAPLPGPTRDFFARLTYTRPF